MSLSTTNDPQIEWNQTVDLQRSINAMSFSCLNSLKRWAGLRNADQFNSFPRHSMQTTNTPTLCVSSLRVCPIAASPDFDLLVLDDLIFDRLECPPDVRTQMHDSDSAHSTPTSIEPSIDPLDAHNLSHGTVHSNTRIADTGGGNKSVQSSVDSPVESVAVNHASSDTASNGNHVGSKSSEGTSTNNLEDTKFNMIFKTLLQLQQQADDIKVKNGPSEAPANPPSGRAK